MMGRTFYLPAVLKVLIDALHGAALAAGVEVKTGAEVNRVGDRQ